MVIGIKMGHYNSNSSLYKLHSPLYVYIITLSLSGFYWK